ncbi:MAG: phosphoribosylanthranilate isomerase [Candidatus Caenarcaniphilales bacterium]|nr:phosphoribosylanthranilate isomerase [Candidatus Caenarcaniphilales bacterium]
MRVKVCGITNQSDSLEAYRSGAHALGFIFIRSSPRYISIDQAKDINRAMPPFCMRIGVFADQEISQVLQICSECRLSAIQIHGVSEDKKYLEDLYHKTSLPIIRALRLRSEEEPILLSGLNRNHIQAILLDGSDISADQCRRARETVPGRPLIIAGSLDADNLKRRIEDLRPDAVDVCRGLEKEPGRKDSLKLRKFFEVASTL